MVDGHEAIFQTFRNVADDIAHHYAYPTSGRDVVMGALKVLAKRLGRGYAGYFPPTVPDDFNRALEVYADVVVQIAASAEGRSQGWTKKKLVNRSLDLYCHTLDPYSSYQDEDSARRSEESRKLNYVGIGVTFRHTSQGYLIHPFRGGPAERAGFKPRDEVLSIDGVDARELTLLDISDRVSGAAGTTVKIRVQHADGVEETISVEREGQTSLPVSVDQVGSTTVRIGFTRINDRALQECRQALAGIGPGRNLILDFRGCGGGGLEAGIKIAELFLPAKTVIARFEFRDTKETRVSENRAPLRPKRLILLQDEGTASAAEIIIAALLGYAPLKAESRGEKSYGKGLVQDEVRVVRGGTLYVTSARIYGPHDEYWEGEGLLPTSIARVDAP